MENVNPKARFDVPWAVYAVVRFREDKGVVVGVFQKQETADEAVKNHGLRPGCVYEVFKYIRDNTFFR